MAQFGDNKFGQMGQQTDEYGNPVQHPTAGGHVGAHGADPHRGVTGGTTTDPHLRRSGSSSSEDDGQGGRRKKGLKDKVMEKLPGGGHKDSQQHPAAGYGGVAGQPEHEKKGVMDKVKEKLPGGQRN